MGRLGDVDADIDVGDGRREAHNDPDSVHHPRRGGEGQQEPRAAYLLIPRYTLINTKFIIAVM